METPYGPFKVAWIEAFGKETLPSHGTLMYWVHRFDASILELALRETIHRNKTLGAEMDSEYRAKWFASCAARIKLQELEMQIGSDSYKCFALVNRNFAASRGTDSDCKVALDQLEVLMSQGTDAFWAAYWNDPTHPLQEQAESMLRRLGPDLTWDDMRRDAARPVNPTNE